MIRLDRRVPRGTELAVPRETLPPLGEADEFYVFQLVGLLVEDPAADLFGNEPVFLGSEWVGYVRAAAYGYAVGGPVALAQVACEDGVTPAWPKTGDFRVRTDERDWPARLQVAPFYDPQRLRILDVT